MSIEPYGQSREISVAGVPVHLPASVTFQIEKQIIEFLEISLVTAIKTFGNVTSVVIDVVLDVYNNAKMMAAYYSCETRRYIEEVVPVTARIAAYSVGLRDLSRPGIDPELAELGRQALRSRFLS